LRRGHAVDRKLTACCDLALMPRPPLGQSHRGESRIPFRHVDALRRVLQHDLSSDRLLNADSQAQLVETTVAKRDASL